MPVMGRDSALHLKIPCICRCHGRRDEAMAKILVEEGPASVRDLIQDGALFDRTADGTLALGREGCHSRNRIVHANGDSTGAEVARAPPEVRTQEPNIGSGALLRCGPSGERGHLLWRHSSLPGRPPVHCRWPCHLATGGLGACLPTPPTPTAPWAGAPGLPGGSVHGYGICPVPSHRP